MFVLFIIAVAASEAGIALALILVLCRNSGNLDLVTWQTVREEGCSPYVDREIPEEKAPEEHWPVLTPAGGPPEVDPQQEPHRSHV